MLRDIVVYVAKESSGIHENLDSIALTSILVRRYCGGKAVYQDVCFNLVGDEAGSRCEDRREQAEVC